MFQTRKGDILSASTAWKGECHKKNNMEILGKLFGGIPRIKIMRLFLLNPEQCFDAQDVADRSRLQGAVVRKTLLALSAMSLIKKKAFVKESIAVRTGKVKKKRVQGWCLSADFPYVEDLKRLLVEGDFFHKSDIVKRFRPAGRIQLLVVSGIFIQDSESRLDVLIVGDNLRKAYIKKVVSILESELGKELSYALFETADFRYRASMYDKLIRDVFEFQHEKLFASKEFVDFRLPL